MLNTLKTRIMTNDTRNDKARKNELFQVLLALDPRLAPAAAVKRSRIISQAPRKIKLYSPAQSQVTRNLLRKYFALRVAQITGGADWKTL